MVAADLQTRRLSAKPKPMSSIRIEKLGVESYEPYDSFLRHHQGTLVYYSSKYKMFLEDLLGCHDEYLLAVQGEEIRGVLPLMFIEHQGKRVYNSLPFYGSNGGIVAVDVESEERLAATYNEIARAETTLSATIVSNPFGDTVCERLPYNQTDERIAQFTNLRSSPDPRSRILSGIDSSARRNISKAKRNGITVQIDQSQFDRLSEMHQANIRAIGGLPKSDRFFNLVAKHFLPGRDFDLYVAKKDGIVVAALLLFYFNLTVEYITPAIDARYRSDQPLSLILIEAMIEARKRGYCRWNWGGTWHAQTGVYRFKKKWSAGERRYRYLVQLNDDSVLHWSQEKILATFPNFYVAPFGALKKARLNVG